MSTQRTIFKGIVFGLIVGVFNAGLHFLLISESDNAILIGADLLVEILIFVGVGIYFYRLIEREKSSETELRKLSRAVEQSPISVVITDLQGNIEYVNPKFVALTGYTLDELRGKNPRILKSGHTPSDEYKRMWETISAGGEWRGELLNTKKNGDLYWEQALMSAVKNGSGKVTHYISVKEDITERKAIQAAEREQRVIAETLRDTAEIFSRTLQLDTVLRHLLLNTQRVSQHETAYVMLIDSAMAKVVQCSGYNPEQAEAMMSVSFPVNQSPGVLHVTRARKAVVACGAEVQSDWRAIPMMTTCHAAIPISQDGIVIGILGLNFLDENSLIPHRLDYLQALANQAAVAIQNAKLYSALRAYALEREEEVIERTSELDHERATLRTMLDGMAEGVLYREQDRYIYANRSLAQMLGCSPDDLLTSVGEIYAHFIVQPSDHKRMQADVNAVLAKNHVWRGDIRARRVDGSEFDAALSIAEVRSASNAVIGRVTLIRDVSQEKALQAQKNRFLAHAAHELRTPMSNIKMRLYLLRKQPEKQDIHLDVLDQATNNMTNLIEDLLDLFRFQGNHIEFHRQKLPLQTIVSEIVNSQQSEAERHEITLHADLPESSILVCVDRRRMGQALSNLVGHAVNRTSPKGEVVIQVGVDHGQATIYLGYTGADAENTADVFEPFFHATEGTDIRIGLGLSIAKEIISLHGGQILTGKQNDQTNGFRITLPAVDCPE